MEFDRIIGTFILGLVGSGLMIGLGVLINALLETDKGFLFLILIPVGVLLIYAVGSFIRDVIL